MSEAKIVITGDASQANSALASLEQALDRTTGKMGAMSALAGPLASVVSITAFASMVKSAIDLGDSLNDLAKRTGASVETLSGLRLAAAQSGVSLETIANGTKKLATSMNENGGAFKRLGIDTTNQTEALIQLGDVFAGMTDPVQRSALAVKIFGKAGDELIPLLMEGSEGIRRMIERGRELGGVTTEMSAEAKKFNDTLAEFKIRSSALGISIAGELLPKLNDTLEAFNDLSKSGASFINIGGVVSTVFETIVVLGANVGYVFQSAGREIGGMAAQLVALSQGDFKGFKRIGEEMKADAEAAGKAIDAFSERILNPVKATAPSVTLKPKEDGKGKDLLNSLTGATKASMDELEKLRQKDRAGWVKYIEALEKDDEDFFNASAKVAERHQKEAEATAAETLKWQQDVAGRLAKIQEAALTEVEIENGKHAQIQSDLEIALSQGFLTEQSFNAMIEQENLRHQAAMGNASAQGAIARKNFEQMTTRQQTEFVLGEMVRMTAGVATSNRAMFEINKIAALAQAAVSLPASVMRAYEAYPPPLSFVMGGLALAAGLAQIDAINNAQFGSSTSAPSVGGGGATPITNVDAGGGSSSPVPVSSMPTVEKQRTQVNITVVGDNFTYQQMVEEIGPLMVEAIGNGAIDLVIGRG